MLCGHRCCELSAAWYLGELSIAEQSVKSAGAMMDAIYPPPQIDDVFDRRMDYLSEIDDICDAILADLEHMGYGSLVGPIRAHFFDSVPWTDIAASMGKDASVLRKAVSKALSQLPCPYMPI